MINIFQLYVFGRVHVVSLVLVCGVIYVGVKMMDRKSHFIYRVLMSTNLVLLGHFVYEDVYIMFQHHVVGHDTLSIRVLILYVAVTIGIGSICSIINDRLRLLRFNASRLCVVASLFFGLVFVMWLLLKEGFFNIIPLFFEGKADPHGPLWAVSKLLGFSLFLPLIYGGGIE